VGVDITDFHFVFYNPGADATGDGDSLFSRVSSSRSGSSMQFQELDFDMGSIPYCTEFFITAANFPQDTVIRFYPTPEPCAVSLMAVGLGGLILLRRHACAR
ncbi:MAG TPA: hypothetical protein VFD66_03810, partial [Verrucomicrobiae bacterium]|nr:hypothetical protein [Verrucomicrobiae bacterium]